MQDQPKLPFFTLLLMISFASVNAVLFTPALPEIARFFAISPERAQSTMIWFLVGYAIGQLFYGPIANRYGRKKALYVGIIIQIFSSFLCAFSGFVHHYFLLVLGRFLLSLGSGVGLKMAFTLVNECYSPKEASQKISYLTLAFAITPALSVALGGFLSTHYGWISCFYAGAIYGLIMLSLTMGLPETQAIPDKNALKIGHLLRGYLLPLRNIGLVSGGLLMGSSSAFVYVFAALAPFIAINLFGLSRNEYGTANLLPAIGLLLGGLLSAQLAKRIELHRVIRMGLVITLLGVLWMLTATWLEFSAIHALFLPMILIYIGLSFIIANASTLAMAQVTDKSHGSAVMNFLNMGMATVMVLSLGFFNIVTLLLPSIYLVLIVFMVGLYQLLNQYSAGYRVGVGNK